MTSKVVLISNGTIGEQMAGPGIRYLECARALAKECAVTLLAPPPVPSMSETFSVLADAPRMRRRVLRECDVVVTQGYDISFLDLVWLAQPLVFDLYDPLFLEASERQPTPATRYFQAVFRERLRLMFARGDLFLTSNDRQKDLYLHLAADLGLPREESRFVTVPFGVRGRGEKEPHGWLRQRWPQIEPGDKIFLWNGGIYPWLDFDTLMHAWARIGMDRADLKLVFLGTGYPGEDREVCALERQAKQQAQELGLLGRLVFFNDEWVPYERYPDYVGEADVVVCTHRQTGESRFALRSRLLDAVANGVPILCSNGDVVGEMVRERGFGLGVAPESVAELVAAACRLADDREFWQRCRQNLLASCWEFDWGKVTAPLQAFCRSPQLAADKPAYPSYLWLLARVVLKVGAHSVRIRGWRMTFRAMLRKVREA